MEFPPYVERIGRMAHVLIPIAKIDNRINGIDVGYDGNTVRTVLYGFLESEFGGCTENPVIWGMWRGIREAHVEITVSFEGKERIVPFLEFLSKLCRAMKEECLYLEMGEDSFLVRPQV